jgi:transposase InsO family protein
MLFVLLHRLLALKGWLARHLRQQPDRRAWRRNGPPPVRRQMPKPAWVQREIVRMKALMPDAGCRRIADTFNRRFARHAELKHRATVGKSFVAETIRKHQYEIATLRRTIRHRVPPPLPRNLVWAMDLTGKGDSTGDTHLILRLIDRGSRALLNLTALPDKASWTLFGHLFLAIGKFGKPTAIRTDNESVFTSRLFRAVLKLAGIRHQRSDPGCPWQNGRIERLFLSLKEKLDCLEVASFTALSSALPAFRFWYNHVRPHQHLQGKTPAEAWAKIDPYAKPVKQELWFEAWEGLLTGYYLRR